MNKLIYPALALLTAVGLYLFYIDPAWTNAQTLLAREQEFDQSLRDAEEITSLIGRLESSYAGISRDDIIRLEKFLPRTIDVTHTVHTLNGIAQSHNAVIESIVTTDVPGAAATLMWAKVQQHSFRFTIRTTYETFKRIMEDVEKNIQLANVRSLSITTNVDDPKGKVSGLTAFTIDLIMYSYDMSGGVTPQ